MNAVLNVDNAHLYVDTAGQGNCGILGANTGTERPEVKGTSGTLNIYSGVLNSIYTSDKAKSPSLLMGFLEKAPVKNCIHYGLTCAKETLMTRQTVSSKLSKSFLESTKIL